MAHPDDELLFANPHLDQDIGAGKRVVTVFLTSGAASNPPYTSREELVRAAHATMAGVANTWTCAPASFGGKMPIQCTLDARPLVSMIFVRLDDGGSLANVLQNGQTAATLDGATTYNAAQLRAVLTDVLASVDPGRVGTLDATLAHGPEHADHVATGNVTFEVARNGTSRQLIMYRGYTMAPPTFQGPPPQPEAVNLSAAEISRKKAVMAVYNQGPVTDPDFSAWCERFYPVASVTGGAALIHAAGGGCLEAATSAEGAVVTVAATCAAGASQNWTATADGRVTGPGGRCLSLNGTAAVIRTCTGAADQTWTLMTNGQLRGRGTSCLARSGTAVSSATCTADTSAAQYRPPVSQRWNF